MNIKPDNNWRWYFDTEYDRMMLDLSNIMLFRSRFTSKMLISDAFEDSIFTLDDAGLYYSFSETCSCLSLTLEQRAELTLNAVVAKRFLKPLLPKSWYFAQQFHEVWPKCAELVAVNVIESGENALLLVVESGEQASLCLVAQPRLLIANRTLLLGEAIKIMNDRFISVAITQEESDPSFSRAM